MKKELPKPTNPHASLYEAIEAWCNGRLLARSGYYAGRGPKRSDLNEDHLDTIYEGIKKDYSPEHAECFLEFVEGMTDLSATAFLVAFEYFVGSGCADPKCYTQSAGDQFQVDGRDQVRDMQAQCAVMEAMSRSGHADMDQMESDSIKYGFLSRYGRKDKRPRSKSNNGYFY